MPRIASYLTLAVLLGVLGLTLRARGGTVTGSATVTETPSAAGSAPGADAALGGDVALDAAACLDAGYLCAGLRGQPEARLTRWSDATTVLSVVVPRPAGVEPGRAYELQRAAVRGIRAWHGQPLPLRVEMSDGAAPADIRIAWRAELSGAELGLVRSRWYREGGISSFEVVEFLLVTLDPLDGSRGLTTGEVELAAAHEMGHALGLPHSDSPRDVMYPSNTAARLSVADYRTMEALYALPNGALLATVPEGG